MSLLFILQIRTKFQVPEVVDNIPHFLDRDFFCYERVCTRVDIAGLAQCFQSMGRSRMMCFLHHLHYGKFSR